MPDRVASEANTPDDLARAILAAPGTVVEEMETGSALRASVTTQKLHREAADTGVFSAETLIDVLRHRAVHDAERAHLLITEDTDGEERSFTLTFGELYAAGQRCAAELARRGVPAGGRVALMLPTSRAFFVSYAGILLAGAIPVPIYPPFRADRIEEYAARQSAILNNAEVCLLLTFRRAEAVAKLLRPRVRSLTEVADAEKLIDAADKAPPPSPGALAAASFRQPRTQRQRHRAAAIHVRFHRRSERRNADARKLARQHARDRRSGATRARRCGRELAAAVPRHGLDRRVADAAAFRHAAGGDVAAGFFDAAGALAASVSQTSGNDFGSAEFCLRTLRSKDR